MKRHIARAATLVCVMAAGTGLLTAGVASAATPNDGRNVCSPAVRSNAVPLEWIPRSPREQDRRVRWDQVRQWDRDGDGRISDAEIARFRSAAAPLPGGPRCDRPANPPRRH